MMPETFQEGSGNGRSYADHRIDVRDMSREEP
jgi:hypothetical protein